MDGRKLEMEEEASWKPMYGTVPTTQDYV